MIQKTAVALMIPKSIILNKNLDIIRHVRDALSKKGGSMRGHLLMSIDGYDDIPDEIYEINEIRAYIKLVLDEWPALFYYLSPINGLSGSFLACLGDVLGVCGYTKEEAYRLLVEEGIAVKHELQVKLDDKTRHKIAEGIMNGTLHHKDNPGTVYEILQELGQI